MKKHEGCTRGFHWSAKAYYADALTDPSISFGMYHPEGGTSGEMLMSWHDLGKKRQCPRLEVFSDGWDAMFEFRDLLEILADKDSEDITQEEFVEILLSCGFEDLTTYDSPYG